jgi:hypothetical protein
VEKIKGNVLIKQAKSIHPAKSPQFYTLLFCLPYQVSFSTFYFILFFISIKLLLTGHHGWAKKKKVFRAGKCIIPS